MKIERHHRQTDEQFETNWKQMIDLHREQIFSMNLSIVPSTMDFVSFNHLQSLTLHYLEFNVCVSVLLKLTCLPRLSSLTIYMFTDFKDLNNIYRIILALPMLKYYKFSANESNIDLAFPMATVEQFNTIEILVIDHPCLFEELVYIVSYTPRLRQLHVTNCVMSLPKITMMSPTALINLTHLTIVAHTFQFDDIELLIKRMNFKLKVFDIRASDDFSFLHADRWEQLIVRHLPYLDKFSLFYQESIVEKCHYEIYRGRLNPFLTSFWIERQWFLDIDIDDESSCYSIQSYRYVAEDLKNVIEILFYRLENNGMIIFPRILQSNSPNQLDYF